MSSPAETLAANLSPNILNSESPSLKRPATFIARLFKDLFAGQNRAYGTYELSGQKDERGKALGKAVTLRKRVTLRLWQAHLDGQAGLGIVPIRDDATCVFGAIDIDSYQGFDLVALAKKVGDLCLPLIVIRSKSGGAHLYLFSKEPILASLMRARLNDLRIALGLPDKIEIFPKQDEIKPDEVGGWINMPYFEEVKTERYALLSDGSHMTAFEFWESARSAERPREWFEKPFLVSAPERNTSMEVIPAYKQGFASGNRYNGVKSAIGKHAHDYPASTPEQLLAFAELKRQEFNPPISHDEWHSWRILKFCQKIAAREANKIRFGTLLEDGATFLLNEKGKPKPLAHNAYQAFGHHPLVKGTLAYDQFLEKATTLDVTPWSSSAGVLDNQALRLAGYWLQSEGVELGIKQSGEALTAAAMDNTFDSLRDHINALPEWDRVPRLDSWLINYADAEDSKYVRLVSRKFGIMLMARGLLTSSKVDNVLILISEQGSRKSMFARAMAGRNEWFCDGLPDVRNKDSAIQLQGKQIVELAEFEHYLQGRSAGLLKAFFSREEDDFRVPFGTVSEKFPRRCLLIGTTNHHDLFSDPTGNRRYWPVHVSDEKINLEGFKAAWPQILAEALVAFRANEKWYPDGRA